MNYEDPLVTVYIPTYNRVNLLERAVNSVLNQGYKNLEIIIVDDCSTDGTVAYLEYIAATDSRIRYFLKKQNSGACVSRNIAIKNAKGIFITGLDDDDYFVSNRIELFINSWKNKLPNTKALYSLYFRKSSEGISRPLDKKNKRKLKKKVIANDLLYDFYTGTQIFTTRSLLINNLFDPKMPVWQDFECFYRFLKDNKCCAELVPMETYIVDTSHEHERISGKKIEKVEEAFSIFTKKHNLSRKYSNLVYCHLSNYPNNKVNKINILKRLLYKPTMLDFKRLIKIKLI